MVMAVFDFDLIVLCCQMREQTSTQNVLQSQKRQVEEELEEMHEKLDKTQRELAEMRTQHETSMLSVTEEKARLCVR